MRTSKVAMKLFDESNTRLNIDDAMLSVCVEDEIANLALILWKAFLVASYQSIQEILRARWEWLK
jgi:hypothetical protein